MGGFHNAITKILDPIGVVPKVFGSNDPLNLVGGATKAAEEKTAKEIAAINKTQEQDLKKRNYNKYGISLIGSV